MVPETVIVRCLIPEFDGAIFSTEWKDALWARFFTGAPERQQHSKESLRALAKR